MTMNLYFLCHPRGKDIHPNYWQVYMKSKTWEKNLVPPKNFPKWNQLKERHIWNSKQSYMLKDITREITSQAVQWVAQALVYTVFHYIPAHGTSINVVICKSNFVKVSIHLLLRAIWYLLLAVSMLLDIRWMSAEKQEEKKPERINTWQIPNNFH